MAKRKHSNQEVENAGDKKPKLAKRQKITKATESKTAQAIKIIRKASENILARFAGRPARKGYYKWTPTSDDQMAVTYSIVVEQASVAALPWEKREEYYNAAFEVVSFRDAPKFREVRWNKPASEKVREIELCPLIEEIW